MGVSQRGSLAVSQRGSFMNSDYNVSERGSIKNSMMGSVYVGSELIDENGTSGTRATRKDNITMSSIEDDTTLRSLAEAALTLPFNLLNLEPLQKIKIVTMVYPFVIGKTTLSKKDTGLSDKSDTLTDLNSQRN